jgi:aspartate/methionine/tyrosine aminotransferase
MDKESPHSPVIHLEVGQPNFATPQHVVEATVRALHEGHTNYNPNNGLLSLRESIVQTYIRRGFPTSVDQIVVTVGSSLSLFSLLITLLKPSDECLLPIPGFPNYQAAIAMTGGVSVPYLCHPNQGYLPTLEGIASRCTPRTRCLILCNPGNPTGATYPESMLKEILLWAHARDIFVISDGTAV